MRRGISTSQTASIAAYGSYLLFHNTYLDLLVYIYYCQDKYLVDFQGKICADRPLRPWMPF